MHGAANMSRLIASITKAMREAKAFERPGAATKHPTGR
jgi:hypothetical protein